MKATRTLFVMLFAGILSACAPTQTSRSTGQFVDDAALAARVKTELGQSVSWKQAATVNVDTFRGAVSLSGFVDDPKQKQEIGQAASQVAGVEKVFNNLQIKPRTSGQ